MVQFSKMYLEIFLKARQRPAGGGTGALVVKVYFFKIFQKCIWKKNLKAWQRPAGEGMGAPVAQNWPQTALSGL